MAKPKVAFYWCASCGGCEEAVVDLNEDLLKVAEAVDIVLWPVAMDFKRKDIEALELQPEIPEVEANEDLCSGCGICIAVCSYDASKLEKTERGLVSVIDDLKCKRCGVCISACPAGARTIKGELVETIANT